MKTKITPHEIADMLRPINRKIKNINKGGCGIFAVALCKELLKRGYNAKILSLQSESISIYTKKDYQYSFLAKLRNDHKAKKEPRNGAKGHYMVQIGSYAIDSRGAFKIQKRSFNKYICYDIHIVNILGTIPLADLQYLNKFAWAWNDTFRRTSKGSIEKLIKEQLKKILK